MDEILLKMLRYNEVPERGQPIIKSGSSIFGFGT